MDYPFFCLQSPITDLQSNIDRLINQIVSKEYPGTATRRLFWLPVSQVVSNLDRSDGRDYGKIAVLVLDICDYTPLCAVLINSVVDGHIVRDTESILDQARLPWVTVNNWDMEHKVRQLIKIAIEGKQSHDIKSPLNLTESSLGKAIRMWFLPLSDYCRVIEQVGISEVVDILSLDHRKQLRTASSWSRPKTVDALKALSTRDQYWLLSEFAASSSFDLLILQKTDKNQHTESEWWPLLAVEFDGPTHKGDKGRLNDYKKDRISSEALLPILRIRVADVGRNLVRQAQAEISVDDPAIIRVDLDFIRFMIGEGLRLGSFNEQLRNQAERRFYISAIRKAKALITQGISKEIALDESFKEVDSSKEYRRFERDNMVDDWVDKETRKSERDELKSQYRAIYGVNPTFDIRIDSYGTLRGRLGKIEIPPLQAFCNLINKKEFESLLREFAEHWLFDRALNAISL